MADDIISLDYKDLMKALDSYNREIPNIARKLLRAVNSEAIKKIKIGYKNAGYKSHITKQYGDAGYMANLKGYANKDLSARIIIKKNAYQYKFAEFGTNHKEMIVHRKGTAYRVKSYSIPANPILYPIANSIWKTNRATEIMEKRFQIELDKRFKDKK